MGIGDSFRKRAVRDRAEALISKDPSQLDRMPKVQIRRLLHDLQVHQIELELQNEELRETQSKLAATRDRYNELYEFAPVGYLTLNNEMIISEANLTSAKLLECDRKRLLEKRFDQWVMPESQDVFYQAQRALLEGATKYTCELMLRRGKASSFYAQLEILRNESSAAHALEYNCVLLDVTQRKAAENEIIELNANLEQTVAERSSALEMSNTLLQGIYENAPIGMAVVDAENDYIQCNPTYFQIFGYSETDLLKRPFSSFCEAGYSVEFSKLLEELRSGKRKSFEMDCRITRKDSELVWVHYVISPLSQEGDGGARLIVLVSDITEQRSMEKDLKKSEQSLVDFFESSPIGLLWADSDGRIVRVNPELQEMLKRPAEQLCGRCIQEFDVEEELTEILASLKEGKTIHDHRAHLNLSDGGAVHVLIDAVPLMDAGTVLRTDWYLRDITSRVELERKLLDATERERQNVGIELHDNLGQILHGAYYLSTELKDRLKKREVPEAAELKRIIDSLSHATELVRDLSHGLQPVSPMPDGLVVALRELAEHVRKTYGLKARFVCPEPVVVSNAKVATHLYRIAQEAVSNAVKHSKCERISLWLKSAEGRVILGVRDDGRGLGPTANHQKGIGLKVMHYRAHAINGSIAMQHIARGGTEVVCTIKDSPETKSPW